MPVHQSSTSLSGIKIKNNISILLSISFSLTYKVVFRKLRFKTIKHEGCLNFRINKKPPGF